MTQYRREMPEIHLMAHLHEKPIAPKPSVLDRVIAWAAILSIPLAFAGAAYCRIAYPVCQRPDIWGYAQDVWLFDHWIDPSHEWGSTCNVPNFMKDKVEVQR